MFSPQRLPQASLLAAQISACLLVTLWLVIFQGPQGGLVLAVRTEQTILVETRIESGTLLPPSRLSALFQLSLPTQIQY